MSVIIRCRKTGANNDPSFRIVATDRRNPRDGKYLEALGWYDPKKKDNNFLVKIDRIEAWLKKGAMISPAAKTLYNKAKRGLTSTTTKGKKEGSKKKKSEKTKADAQAAPAATEKPAAAPKPAAEKKPVADKKASTPPAADKK